MRAAHWAPGLILLARLKLSCIRLLLAWEPGFCAYMRFPKSLSFTVFPAGTYRAFLVDAGGLDLPAKGFCSHGEGSPAASQGLGFRTGERCTPQRTLQVCLF